MAASFSIIRKGVAGNMRINVVDVTCDTAYATGGYAVTAANFGVGTIFHVLPEITTGENLKPVYNTATGKLMLLKGASTVTVTSGNAAFSDCAANDTLVTGSTKVRCLVIGDMVTGG